MKISGCNEARKVMAVCETLANFDFVDVADAVTIWFVARSKKSSGWMACYSAYLYCGEASVTSWKDVNPADWGEKEWFKWIDDCKTLFVKTCGEPIDEEDVSIDRAYVVFRAACDGFEWNHNILCNAYLSMDKEGFDRACVFEKVRKEDKKKTNSKEINLNGVNVENSIDIVNVICEAIKDRKPNDFVGVRE